MFDSMSSEYGRAIGHSNNHTVLMVYTCLIGFDPEIPFTLPEMKGKKVQVGKDQEKAHSEKDSHSKSRGGKKKQTTNNQVQMVQITR